MEKTELTRPDPAQGVEADRGYADAYTSSHAVEKDSPQYRLRYAWHLLIDGALPAGYSLLDVGCGTGGYHRLLQRHGHIVGLDFSQEMIQAANGLKRANGLQNIEYVAGKFEDYRPTVRFDVLSLVGVFGWYVPWRGRADILARTADLLKPGGLACVSYVPPRSPLAWAKAVFFPGATVNIRKAGFYRMLQAAGFVPVLEMAYPHATVVVARKQDGQTQDARMREGSHGA